MNNALVDKTDSNKFVLDMEHLAIWMLTAKNVKKCYLKIEYEGKDKSWMTTGNIPKYPYIDPTIILENPEDFVKHKF